MHTAFRVAIILAGSASSALAQGWTGGVKAGLGQSGYSGTSEFAWSAAGFNASVFLSRPVAGRVSLQTEIAATQKIGQSSAGGALLTFTSDDISLPVLFKIDYRRRGAFTPFVVAGPSLTFRANCNMQFVVAGQVSSIDCDQPSFLSRFDFGVVTGAGVGRTIGSTVVSAEARTTVSARSVAVPDGSGYGRAVGWSLLMGASAPIGVPRFVQRARTVATLPIPADSASGRPQSP